ncbi:type II secretion system protein [bacterium]|nr:type II secretion system protein [bacterium]
MKKGFTLAEVLITLVIIGVIAAMTIPTLMNSTNAQEYRTGLKKAISTLNQALSLNYALEGTSVGDDNLNTASGVVNNLFIKRMSVVSTATSGGANGAFGAGGSGVTTDTVFYTADGMRFAVGAIAAAGPDDSGEYYYGNILIDVNGEKGPNTLTTTSDSPRDTYVGTLYGTRVVAGKVGDDSSNWSKAAREVLFDKKSAAVSAH